MLNRALCLTFSLTIAAALTVTATAQTEATEPAAEPDATETAAEPDAWVTARVAETHSRLVQSEGGRLIWAAIEAHGGLSRWFLAGDLHFQFRYAPVGDRPARDTVQTIDQWSSRARHHVSDDPDTQFGWSGTQAWLIAEDESSIRSPRFWALTPYYFVGVPFVLADPGTVHTVEESVEFEGRTFDQVRVSYEPGTGDAPDDYYIVLIDRETRQVGGVRYIVTYPGFFPDGGHSDEKWMAYDGTQTIDGITFAESYRTFSMTEQGEPDELVTNSTLTDVAFRTEVPVGYYDPPEGAQVLEGY